MGIGDGGRRPVGTRRRTTRGALVVAVVTGSALLGACAPTSPSGPPADPAPPTIQSFSLGSQRRAAPVVGSLGWNVSDPNPGALRCRVDVDGDGAFDREFEPCTSADRVLVSFDAPGTRTLTLEVSDSMFEPVVATTTVTVDPGPAEGYEIDLRLDPTMRPEFREAFEAAAARWSEVIVAGAPDQQLDIPAGFLGWIPAFSGVVDDVLIDARDIPIDGPRGTLGRAAGLAVREGAWQPYWGLMEFDTDDLEMLHEQGRLGDVILHEMGHVLGLGGNWLLNGLIDNPLLDPRYTGAAGVAAYRELGGSGPVPLEHEGGLGTMWGHWRESVFDRELMTGFLDLGAQSLSRLSVAALADQGYGVSLDAADDYELPGPPSAAALRAAPDPEDHLHTESMEPIIVGGTGR